MPELKNKVAIEGSRPLTERGWDLAKGFHTPRLMKNGRILTPKFAERIQALEGKPLLIAELERVKAENEAYKKSHKIFGGT